MPARVLAPRPAAVGLTAAAVMTSLGAVHFAWARGSAWPFADRARLAAAVDGVGEPQFPGRAMTYGVSGALFAAGALVAAAARGPESPRSLARPPATAVAAVFAARGLVGLVHPRLLPAGELPPFARLNTLIYSPLCLAIAAAIAHSLRGVT